jgi:crotonobetainyl-CoA:carnitine CoA-transferase CaiB-like acyl-CoA transferase
MVPHFDIVIENFRPGTLERWGLGFDSLAKLNVGLILARISGYGQTGPYAMRPGYGTVAEAMSGVPSFTGFPDKPPTLSAFTLVDALAGLFAVQGALMALYERNTSGCGQVVDVSLFESLFRLVDPQVIAYDQLAQIKPRQGNRLTGDSPRNAYRTLDGRYITISAGSKRTFARLASAIGMPELANDPRFADVQSRCANVDELDQIISQWFEARSMPEAMTMLEEHDVVAGPVYDIADIFDDPQYRAREDIVSIDDPDLGTVRMQGIVPKLSRTPGAVIHTGGAMGEGNEAFYTTIGLTEREITELRAEGVI